MLTRRTATEVLFSNDDIARIHLFDKGRVQIFQAMLREFSRVGGVQITRRDDDVSINVSSVAMYRTFVVHELLLIYIFRQTDMTKHRTCSGNSWRREIHLARRIAHATNEISIGGSDRALPCCQNAHITTQARTAGRG